jgi:hypothetical protein
VLATDDPGAEDGAELARPGVLGAVLKSSGIDKSANQTKASNSISTAEMFNRQQGFAGRELTAESSSLKLRP